MNLQRLKGAALGLLVGMLIGFVAIGITSFITWWNPFSDTSMRYVLIRIIIALGILVSIVNATLYYREY